MDDKKRILFFDYARALCIFWIVGFWHFSEYCAYSLGDKPWASNTTVGVLGTFAFISAFFLGKKEIKNKTDVIEFYKKRLLRIYPLFFVSCISFFVLHLINGRINYISSFKQLLLTLLGISCFFTPAPYTVWFVSMLIFLYSVTPLFNHIKSQSIKGCVLFLISIIIVLTKYMDLNFDNRLRYLIPLYCLGLFLSNTGLFDHMDKSVYCLFSLVGLIILGLFSFSPLVELHSSAAVSILIAVSMAAFLLCLLRCLESQISRVGFLSGILVKISYSSFCIYLFHRQVFGAISLVVSPFPVIVAYLIVLPVTFTIMYYLQKLYDAIIHAHRGL